MTINLVREFTENIAATASSVDYGRGQLLAIPWTVGYDESVQIYVEQIGDDLFLLTDRGMSADSLGDFGIDLSAKGARRSWDATIRHSALAPATFVDVGEWEIATTVSRAELGNALTALGETIVRTDGLRALVRRRATTYRERAIARAGELGLGVIPGATIPGKFAPRKVSFGVGVGDRIDAYFETLSGRNVMDEVDQSRIVFLDAEQVNRDRKVALVASSAKLKSWQLTALEQVGRVVDESRQDEFFVSLVA